MKTVNWSVFSLLIAVCVILGSIASPGTAHAASTYDNIIQTTPVMELQTSTSKCLFSSPVDHTSDWMSKVSAALADYNAASGNSAAAWESDWHSRVGAAVISVTGNSSQKRLWVLYSATGGENSFFSSGGNDFFAITDFSPITPFRFVELVTTGDFANNCDQTPVVASIFNGGLALTAADFVGVHKLVDSSFPTDEPLGYEGVPVPVNSHLTTPYVGTVDCGGEAPMFVSVYQPGNNGVARLSPLSTGRAEWRYNLTSDQYSVTVGCGSTLAGAFGAVYAADGVNWVCDAYGPKPHYCVLG
ncbi:hypothetical protein I8H89_04085 [Candidatus Saccharibacteria bacterium]|nr:hypothetical protein [Candidatus Saccharibacteria bacterium]